MIGFFAVLFIPGIFFKLLFIITEKIPGCRTCAAGIFPFCFCWQAVEYPCFFKKPAAIGQCCFLLHAVYRKTTFTSHIPGKIDILGTWSCNGISFRILAESIVLKK